MHQKVKQQLRGNQINWNQVFYFSEIAANGSIKEAARKLELSPSTLSEHIAELEKDLKVKLFHRSHRKLILTPEGSKLFQHAKQMFETGQRLIDVVSPIPLGCYPVSVGLVPSSSTPIAYRLMSDYLLKGEDLNMKFFHSSHAELEKGLAEARFDFGFSNRMPERKDLVYQVISSSHLNFYVKTELAHRKISDLLQEFPLLVCNAEQGSRNPVEKFLEDLDLIPRSVVTADFPALLLEFAENGRGIAVFSEEVIRLLSPGSLRLLRVPKDAPRFRDALYALWTKGSENSEAIRHLKTLLPSPGVQK